MSPSPFLIQLAILLLPGVIWAHLDSKFATKGNLSQVEFLGRALIFGLTAYIVTYFVFWLVGHPFELVDVREINDKSVLTRAIVAEIGIATVIGFVLSIIWMYGVTYKGLTRFLQWIRATKTFGDEDVWDFLMNSKDAASEYVHVRDFENRIVYAGWVAVFSESGKLRELVLNDAQIFDFDGVLLFATPRVYIARKAEGMHVEFPATAANIREGQQP
jgi:hypothetical protein